MKPKKIIDLGAGTGLYSCICRQYLDIAEGRIYPKDWQTEIIGVEGFSDYRNPMWNMYTGVWIEDFSKNTYEGYDLVLLNDSLEHLDKATGLNVLQDLLVRNKYVLVSVPDGDYPQGAVNGNEYECHRARWQEWEFKTLAQTKVIHRGTCLVVLLTNSLLNRF